MTGLEFMGKDWDRPWAVGFAKTGYTDGGNRPRRPNYGSNRNPMCRSCRKHQRGTDRCHCDPPDFDERPLDASRVYQAWCEQWATDALRVLRPGGWLLAFGGTRTWHRLACGIEDAGFEMRDTKAEFSPAYGPLAWIYGQGFPKGRACLKPAWEPVIVARRPGSSVLQIDASRIATTDALGGGAESRTTADQKGNDGWVRPWMSDPMAQEAHAARVRANVEKAERLGRWPSNVALVHSEGCQSTGTRKIRTEIAHKQRGVSDPPLYGKGLGAYPVGTPNAGYADADGMEEVTAWTCEEDCPVFLLDQQSGDVRASGHRNRSEQAGEPTTAAMGYMKSFALPGVNTYADQGGASRFMYTAKAGPNERVTIDGEGHPTVKPLALMRWLVRLVTPPGGLVLDMFAGSGTTGEAAMLEGFRCVLIDKDPANLPSIRVRTHPYVRRTKVVTNGHQTGPEQGSLL